MVVCLYEILFFREIVGGGVDFVDNFPEEIYFHFC